MASSMKKTSKFSELCFSLLDDANDIITLADIWDKHEFRSHFRNASMEWLSRDDVDGEVLIVHDNIRDYGLVGVTGWGSVENGSAFIRWHGVIVKERKKGYSKQMVDFLITRLRDTCEIHTLYELSDTEAARDYFLKYGFVEVIDKSIIESLAEVAGEFKYALQLNLDP